MRIRLIAIASATALASCAPQVPQTAGYTYPHYWGTSPSLAANPGDEPSASSLASSNGTQSSTALFGTHTAAAPGVWLFPPDPYQ